MRARPFVVALATGAVLVASGCGGGTAPADDVPALGTALAEVDDAIAAGEYDAARDAITELTDVARRARTDGGLDRAEADRIEEAADQLLAALPDGDDGEPSEPAPEAPPTSTPFEQTPDEGTGQGKGQGRGGDKGKNKDKDKNKDKGKGSGPGPRGNDDHDDEDDD